MIEKLTGLLRHTVRYLEESASPMSPDTVLGEPEEQPSANGQAAPATTQVVRAQLTLLWQRVVGDLRSHLDWLWGHPWVIRVSHPSI